MEAAQIRDINISYPIQKISLFTAIIRKNKNQRFIHFADKKTKKNLKIRYHCIDNYLTSKYNAYSDIVKKISTFTSDILCRT